MNDHVPTLVELNAPHPRYKVFCPHPPGSGLAIYQPLASMFEGMIGFCGLEDPVVYADATFQTFQEMGAIHVRAIRQAQPEGPYVLLGICAAGATAYEIAYQLANQGQRVHRLVMIGSYDLAGFDPAHAERHRFLEKYLFENFLIDLADLNWNALEDMEREEACMIVARELRVRVPGHRLPPVTWIQKSLVSLCMTREVSRQYTAPMSSLEIDLYRIPHEERPIDAHRDWCDLGALTQGTMTIHPHAPELHPRDDMLSGPLMAPLVESLKKNAFSCFLNAQAEMAA